MRENRIYGIKRRERGGEQEGEREISRKAKEESPECREKLVISSRSLVVATELIKASAW